MKITKLNYKYLYPEITKTLSECNALAIDFEFSGTSLRKELVNTRFDDPNIRYFKIKENIKNFMPLQVGICGFKYNTGNRVNLYPMNFYIFPHTNSEIDKKYYFDVGSINFLASNGFDFNKTFYDGIRYISLYDYEKMKKTKSINQIIKNKREEKISPPEARAVLVSYYPHLEKFVQKMIKNNLDLDHPDNIFEFDVTYMRKLFMDYFLSNINSLFKYEEKSIMFEVEMVEVNLIKTVMRIKITDEKRLEEKSKSISKEKDYKKFSSWLYYQSIAMGEADDAGVNDIWQRILKNFEKIHEIFQKNKKTLLNTTNNNPADNSLTLQALSRSILSLDQPEELYKLGFTRVISDIIKYNKPLIFHNGLLDLIHLVDKFIEPVPDTFEDFKKVVNKYFPTIYDTKYMIENNTSVMNVFRDSSLEVVSKKILSDEDGIKSRSNINFEIEEMYKGYDTEINSQENNTSYNTNNNGILLHKNNILMMNSHEAGYDSMVTTITFIYIFKLLFKNLNFIENKENFDKFLEIFRNKLLFSGLQYACDLEVNNIKVNQRENLSKTSKNSNKTNDNSNNPNYSRFDIFVISELPEIITADEIKASFKAHFNISPRVYKLFGINIGYVIFTVNSEKEEFIKKLNLEVTNNNSKDNKSQSQSQSPIAVLPLQNYNKIGLIFKYSDYTEILRNTYSQSILDLIENTSYEATTPNNADNTVSNSNVTNITS